jgi:hypothetical protein
MINFNGNASILSLLLTYLFYDLILSIKLL